LRLLIEPWWQALLHLSNFFFKKQRSFNNEFT
jgi:hypothetical protein